MAYPAGPLPTAGERAGFSQRVVPTKSVSFTGGGSDLDLTDPANGLNPCATEFYVTTAGTLVARLAGDSADRTYGSANLPVNTVVKGLFTVIRSTSTAAGIVRQ